jgi:GrpB-like predicted nucleotidyltransferase (UPF0157 family)
VLHAREPDWYEHRLLKPAAGEMNLHAFSVGSTEISRCRTFRDWLRVDRSGRQLHEQSKRRLAARHWNYMQNCADAKGHVIEAIRDRANRTKH